MLLRIFQGGEESTSLADIQVQKTKAMLDGGTSQLESKFTFSNKPFE
jgi:hypothetical protein